MNESARKKKENIEEEEIPKSVRKMKKTTEEEDKKKNKHPKLKKFILFSLLVVIIVLLVRLIISTHRWKMLARDMMANQNSIILDIDGNVIAKLGEDKIKIAITSDNIPENLKNAYVSIEDERFYSHGGVDAKRTTAAIGSYIIHFGSSSFGGSTITQQLVKNMTGNSADKPSRKIDEWWKSITLESCTSKDEILTAYLNTIYVGPNIYGVEAGAQYYFNKSAKDLTLEECAFMAGINNSPNSYNPFTETDNAEKINKRTKLVLDKMKELGKISSDEYDKALENLNDGLKFEKGKLEAGSGVYSYHTDALINEVTDDIANKYKISKTFAMNYLESAGVTIYSTQDSNIQKEIETEFEKSKYKLDSKQGGESSQAAMIIMDHKTGYVVGCAGGLGKKEVARPLNRAVQSVRQTGSAMKPIAILAPAIDKKIVTAATILDDTERDFEGGYYPEDYNTPLGKITLRRAVESSQNVPFVEILEKLEIKTSIKYMKKMGITSLTEKDESLSLALGGLDRGISPLEMAGAYSTIANDGVYIEPTFYTEVIRRNGKSLVKTKQKEKKVFSEETAYVLKELLTQPVLGTNGTATYCKINGVDVAAKTGTTDENYDRWLCGFTPYYTATCWYGYDQNESIDFNQRNPAGLIWANVMTRIHSGKASARFIKPSKIETATICSETGKVATTGCAKTYTEYFIKGTVPGICDKHAGNAITTNYDTTNKNSSETITVTDKEIDEKEPAREVRNETSENTTKTENTTSTDTTVTNNTTNSTNISNVTNTTTTNIPEENIVDPVTTPDINETINITEPEEIDEEGP